jgi:hypothetical protein
MFVMKMVKAIFSRERTCRLKGAFLVECHTLRSF